VQNVKTLSALAALLLWVVPSLVAQPRLPDGSRKAMLEMTSRMADIDSSLPVKHYSLAQRVSLLKQLYRIDQRYRDSLEDSAHPSFRQQLFEIV